MKHPHKTILAEGEGFEPPVPERELCISSAAQSAKLCHPSVKNFSYLLNSIQLN